MLSAADKSLYKLPAYVRNAHLHYFDAVHILVPSLNSFYRFSADSQLAKYRTYKQTSSNQHTNLHTVVVGQKGCRKEATYNRHFMFAVCIVYIRYICTETNRDALEKEHFRITLKTYFAQRFRLIVKCFRYF